MKKYILLPLLAMSFPIVSIAQNVHAMDVNPLASISKNNLKFSVGGRFAMDGAYIKSEYSPVNSGVAISDARVRTSLSVGENWFFTADFDFAYNQFEQKNLFGQYLWNNSWVKLGYFCEPSSMNLNTSRFNLHFINRPGVVNALGQGRSIGLAYKYGNNLFYANQGIFSENEYNDQANGSQGFAASGRWLIKPLNNDNATLHIGGTFRYATLQTGKFEDGVLHRDLTIGTTLENNVYTPIEFLNTIVPWASSEMNISVEALAMTKKVFVRGEYLMKRIGRDRNDQRLFENQLGGMYSWGTLESWQNANPLKTINFNGGYVEAGVILKGDKYEYDNDNSVLKGLSGKNNIELVGRYNYTNLNDITEGDFYFDANDKFYPNFDGSIPDFPTGSSSIAGGAMHSFTLGLNYGVNNYIKVMLDYTHSILDNVRYSYDKNFSILQTRVMVVF